MNRLKQFVWPIGILGLALLIIGLISVTAPNMTVETLMLYFGVMLLIIGGVQVLLSVLLRTKIKQWVYILVVGLLFSVLGFYMVKNASEAAAFFTLSMAVWAGVMGVIQLFMAFNNPSVRIFLISMGSVSLFFGALIFINPFSGPNTLQFMVGFYTLLLSFFILYTAVRILTTKNKPVDGESASTN